MSVLTSKNDEKIAAHAAGAAILQQTVGDVEI
jgi:hypothetical protein